MLELRVLGTLELLRDGAADETALRQARCSALLAYLALTGPGGFQSRDRLVGLFWSDLPDLRGQAALNKAVHHLRAVLGGMVVVRLPDGSVGLNWAAFTCDAVRFEQLLDSGDPEGALRLYRGELLPGFHHGVGLEFSQWLDTQGERLRSRAVGGARAAARAAAAAGRAGDATYWAAQAIELDPYSESTLLWAADVLTGTGDRAVLRRAYDLLRSRLAGLDLEPGPRTNEAIRTALATPASAESWSATAP